jgi:hypothetical protein
MTEQELLRLKKKVEDTKQQKSQLEGQKVALMKQLKDDWKVKSLEEATAKMNSLAEEVEQLTKQIEKGSKELEEKYEL